MLLLMLFACSLNNPDASIEVSSSDDVPTERRLSIHDVAHYESPCLEGVVYNMIESECIVMWMKDKRGATRWMCFQDSEGPDNLWVHHTFYAVDNTPVEDDTVMDVSAYRPVCSDWSLDIVY